MINDFNNNISFCGATRWFKKEIFNRQESINKIINSVNSDLVGSLPKEIIYDVINLSKNDKDKTKRIKNIMNGFSELAQRIEKLRGKLEKYGCYWECNSSFRNEIFIKVLEKKLNKLFKKNDLIGLFENIKVEPLGGGSFGDVFLVNFSERKSYKPLVFKLYKNRYLSELLTVFNHGGFAENNIMIYVTNLFKKSKEASVFADGYFGSTKNNFLVSEYVPDVFRSNKRDWIYTAEGKKDVRR